MRPHPTMFDRGRAATCPESDRLAIVDPGRSWRVAPRVTLLESASGARARDYSNATASVPRRTLPAAFAAPSSL